MKEAAEIRKVAVLGCGLIGFSWGVVFARNGLNVNMYNRKSKSLHTVTHRIYDALRFLKEEGMIENAARMGEYFLKSLQQIQNDKIKEIRGRGLMIGLEFHPEAGGARQYMVVKRIAGGNLALMQKPDHVRGRLGRHGAPPSGPAARIRRPRALRAAPAAGPQGPGGRRARAHLAEPRGPEAGRHPLGGRR